MDLVHLGGLRLENTSHPEHYNSFFFLLQCIISMLNRQPWRQGLISLWDSESLVQEISTMEGF